MNEMEIKENIATGLFKMLIFMMSVKPNNRTKVPTVVVTQEDAASMIDHIATMLLMMGKRIVYEPTENGQINVSLVEVNE